MQILTGFTLRIVLSFMVLGGSLWSIVILLNCLWQSEKRLKIMIGLFTLALAVRAFRIIVQIITLNYSTSLYSNVSQLDLGVSFITTILFLWGAIELKAMISSAQLKKIETRNI